MKATRSLEESATLGDFKRNWLFSADGLSFAHTGHILEPAWQLPISRGAQFSSRVGSPSRPSQPSTLFRSLALHPSAPSLHHTPWGRSCSDWTTSTASGSGYGVRSTWCALTAISTASVPSSACPRVVGRGTGHPTPCLTVVRPLKQDPRLLPGSCPTPFVGKEYRRRRSVY